MLRILHRFFIFCLLPLPLLTPASQAWAQSAELMQHYRQYQALDKVGKYREAEVHAKKTLEIGKREFGHEDTNVGIFLNNLAEIYKAQARYSEAIPLYKKALAIEEIKYGKNHPSIGITLGNLASIYKVQARYSEAVPFYKRALAIFELRLGKNHPHVATTLNNFAGLHEAQDHYKKAEQLYKRALSIYELRFGKNHPHVAATLNNLAVLYGKQGLLSQAESLLKKDLAITEAVFGENHPSVAISLNNLAKLKEQRRKYSEANLLFKRALSIRRAVFGKNHSIVAVSLNNLATLYFLQNDWPQAAEYWRQATGVLTRRAALFGTIGRGVRGKKKSEVSQRDWFFTNLVKSVFRESLSGKNRREMFLTAQWAMQSRAAEALAQMSARQAAGSGELSTIVRERQDSVRLWQQNEKRMNALRGAGKRDRKLQAQMTNLDRRIAQIDNVLAKDFPDYAALASPKPLSVSKVQKLVKPDEALILLLDTPKTYSGKKLITPAETFIWAVTRDKAVWKRAELGGKELAKKVAALRKELDPATASRGKEKRGFEGIGTNKGFDLAIANELYAKLLGPIEEIIRDKHLLVVGSGPLTALPFQVLVKAKPDAALAGDEKYQKADWLIRHHAITTLPSVASLKALRGIGKKSGRAAHPLIGFADPVFRQPEVKPLKLARAKGGYASYFRGRNVDLATLSGLSQLPGTRTELQGVGKFLGVDKKHLKYGRDASERAVKKAKLNQFRIVYFATHGLVSGDVQGLGEPALAFSLPADASPEDDGLLTASEVTQLKLNADWVVMSACNTAAADKPGAEALSGLARAFFYAGAETLLVSHWPVGDEAAVALTTRAFKDMQANPKLGRSQALRRSMLALLGKGGLDAHPTTWAPFVVVGERSGGR